MKRYLLLLLVSAALALCPAVALAQGEGLTVSLAGPGEVRAGEIFTLVLSVSGPYNALQATISYDQDELAFVPDAVGYGEKTEISCDAAAGELIIMRYGQGYTEADTLSLAFAVNSNSAAEQLSFSVDQPLAGMMGNDLQIPPAAGAGLSVKAAGLVLPRISAAAISGDKDAVTATLNTPAGTGWQLMAAAYDSDGRMIAVSMNSISPGSYQAGLILREAGQAERVRLFVLDQRWSPLTPTYEIE